jgi:hypothetical protein
MPQIITPLPKAPDAGIGSNFWHDGFWDGEPGCRDGEEGTWKNANRNLGQIIYGKRPPMCKIAGHEDHEWTVKACARNPVRCSQAHAATSRTSTRGTYSRRNRLTQF